MLVFEASKNRQKLLGGIDFLVIIVSPRLKLFNLGMLGGLRLALVEKCQRSNVDLTLNFFLPSKRRI
jgi:hypothetical protein